MSATGRMFHEQQDNKDEMIQELVEILEQALRCLQTQVNAGLGSYQWEIDRGLDIINKIKGA